MFRISSKRIAKVNQREPKGAKREPQGDKNELKLNQRDPTVSHLEAQWYQKWAKGRPKCIPKSVFGKGREKGAKSFRPSSFLGLPFGNHFHKKYHRKFIQKSITKKYTKIMSNCFQNGAGIDAKNHKNKCLNLYRKRSGKSSKIMFLWRVKSLKFIRKTNVFDALEGCMCER